MVIDGVDYYDMSTHNSSVIENSAIVHRRPKTFRTTALRFFQKHVVTEEIDTESHTEKAIFEKIESCQKRRTQVTGQMKSGTRDTRRLLRRRL